MEEFMAEQKNYECVDCGNQATADSRVEERDPSGAGAGSAATGD